ncbi:hypothetical protein L6452_14590 [Arctium lappa]|uniref:Uncharacterized protein n=1 Tax=Arctium lappa TaxID=4217 RepID=A0ACB9CLX7_ARCLA|nr:hypothetical protein L6452_14590 [Arctium lappa]
MRYEILARMINYLRCAAKLSEDGDFKKEPVIEIGSSSRCKRNTRRSKENKDETPKKDTHEDKVLLSETKSKVKYEGSSVRGVPIAK